MSKDLVPTKAWDHVVPLVPVIMVPTFPTSAPVLLFVVQRIAFKFCAEVSTVGVQAIPSVVFNKVPASPTAYPVLFEVK